MIDDPKIYSMFFWGERSGATKIKIAANFQISNIYRQTDNSYELQIGSAGDLAGLTPWRGLLL
jgi:hypothetical protein